MLDPQLIQRPAELILKELRGEQTEAEARELQDWLAADAEHRAFYERMTSAPGLQSRLQKFGVPDEGAAWQRFAEKHFPAPADSEGEKVKRMDYRWWAAAAVIVAAAAGIWLWKPGQEATKAPVAAVQRTILPATSKAVLTLADGTTIPLDSAGNQTFAQQGATASQHGGSLVYQPGGKEGALQYNTLRTPRGGQFRIALPDGSQVWLNAGSSLRFPVAFGPGARKVELTGEAYFEVRPDAAKPFTVAVDGKAEVAVLGTEFNINAYADEPAIRATLVKGSVAVTAAGQTRKLAPGQQAAISGGAPVVDARPDVEEALAWRNAVFYFRNADVKAVMRQLQRWYDVEVEYRGNVPDRRFDGEIQRDLPLQDVLDGLRVSGISFTIEGSKIIIQPL
ncbi:FecR family protein [Chitinophaga caseinilytica]|uniref:FecR domain-containing protein n=1 Tax=Chitinophaga caseinilytica TaxID=2267521 RepID=A0ABZ2Z3B0_9BACT